MQTELILAPMAGATDKPFRQMVRKFGNHLLFTEMIASTSLCHGSKQTRRMVDITDETGPIAIQLVGNDPDEMARAAQMVQEQNPAWIDINMGCPVKKLISNMSGSALMLDVDRAFRMLEAVKKSTHVPVSVKTRLGWDNISILDFAKGLENAGADRIIIHGRTKVQGYSGTANWAPIADVKKSGRIPVIANGDIRDISSAEECLNQTQADGLMVGRGALGQPWLLAELSGQNPTYNTQEIILEHLDRMISYYGPKGLFIARKHLAWYATGKTFVAEFRKAVYAEKKRENVEKLIKEFFG